MPGKHTLSAVVFDWAGTLLDFGSLAPVAAFQAVFARWGVPVSVSEVREPMGLPKRAHIEGIAALPRVARAWREVHGQAPSRADIDAMYAAYTPMNVLSVGDHARPIPGAAAVLEELRERGLRIGSTTGYPREVMDALLPLAHAQGLAPDNVVCTDEVPIGRPSPLAMYRCFLDLAVWPAWRAVKVDDTVPGLQEGQSAGSWTVAVTDTGNAMGLADSTWGALPAPAREALRHEAGEMLAAGRPDYTIGSIAELPAVLDAINERLARGERPRAPA